MPDINVNAEEVFKLLTNLDITKTTNPDDIPLHILLTYAVQIATELTNIS